MNCVGHALHTFRADTVIGGPVSFADLIAVVNVHPLEAKLHNFGKRADDFIHCESALIAPGAPHWLVGIIGRYRHLIPVGVLHILREIP